MTFSALGMYYVHGRWYNPWTGRFVSPDEKGEYLYGSGNDPINWDWIAEQGIALGKSGPVGRWIVLGGGQFIVETSDAAQCAIYQPPGSNVLWCATRATVPVVIGAAPLVYGGLSAAHAGTAYLGRTLLGRTITGASTACAADQRDCANAGQQVATIGLRGLQLSQHALQRISERGVSLSQLGQVVKTEPFSYFHEGVWKTGFYDPASKIFVGSVDNIITTVITNVKPQYIENLKRVMP